MLNYTIQNCSTKVVLKKGKIEEEAADAIVNWVNVDMRSGPKSFYNIHRAAGMQLFEYMIPFDETAVECDCFSTNAGQLSCNIVLHTIIPIHKMNYLFCFQNMADTIKAYKKKNILRSVAIFIPEMPDMILPGIHKFILNIGLEEVRILYRTDNEYKIISEYFSKFANKMTFRHRIEYKFWKFMEWFAGVKLPFLSGMMLGKPAVIKA